jgi:hypothetical protein
MTRFAAQATINDMLIQILIGQETRSSRGVSEGHFLAQADALPRPERVCVQ